MSPLKARLDAASDRGGDSSIDAGHAGDAGPSENVDGDASSQADASADRGDSNRRDSNIGDSNGDIKIGDSNGDIKIGDSSVGDSTDGGVLCSCSTWGQAQAEGPSPAQLPELSGLAASHLHPGLLYAHNDSGDTARFFAMTAQAHVTAELHLAGATATDWEDISVGPCSGGSCVYIGDTGDNKRERSEYVIHRLVEPATLPTDGGVVTIPSTDYESFPFVYPDGPHNAETLLVHPVTGQVFVVLKETGLPAAVYEMPLPLKAGQQVTLTLFTSLSVPAGEGVVTDGNFHPCGDRLLIRTTTGLFEMVRAPGASLTSLFMATPVRVPLAVEPQGEGISYALDGRSYFTSSETVSGQPTPSLSMVTCLTP